MDTAFNPEVSLDTLEQGEKGIIKNINSTEVPLKFIELGCLPGSEITVIQKAPFGNPIYISISGSYFSIRKEVALLIEIEKTDE